MKLIEIRKIIDEQLCNTSINALVHNDDFWKSEEKVLISAASYLQEKGLPKRSIELCEEIEKQCSSLSSESSLNLKYILGSSFHDLNRFEDAVRVYTEIIRASERDIAFTNRGLALWELGRHSDALSDYCEAVKLNPTNYIALRGAGDNLIQLGDFDKAILYLTAAIKINPKYGAGHTALAAAYFKVDDFKAARRLLRKALRLNPTDQIAVRGLEETEKRLHKADNVSDGGSPA